MNTRLIFEAFQRRGFDADHEVPQSYINGAMDLARESCEFLKPGQDFSYSGNELTWLAVKEAVDEYLKVNGYVNGRDSISRWA